MSRRASYDDRFPDVILPPMPMPNLELPNMPPFQVTIMTFTPPKPMRMVVRWVPEVHWVDADSDEQGAQRPEDER